MIGNTNPRCKSIAKDTAATFVHAAPKEDPHECNFNYKGYRPQWIDTAIRWTSNSKEWSRCSTIDGVGIRTR
jgi:hypothetical protein